MSGRNYGIKDYDMKRVVFFWFKGKEEGGKVGGRILKEKPVMNKVLPFSSSCVVSMD